MFCRHRHPSRKRRGFTLIELMIVIAIIGVLAAIAVPNFQAARKRANLRACWANQKTVAGALEMYNLDKNTDLKVGEDGYLQKLKEEGYLQAVPKDPGFNDENSFEFVEGGYGIKCKNHGEINSETGAGGATANNGSGSRQA